MTTNQATIVGIASMVATYGVACYAAHREYKKYLESQTRLDSLRTIVEIGLQQTLANIQKATTSCADEEVQTETEDN